jgi:protein-disulfide isomerase
MDHAKRSFSGKTLGRRAVIAGVVGAAGGALASWRFLPANEQVVRRYLKANPEFLADHPHLVEASAMVLETRRLAGEAAERKVLIAAKWAPAVHAAFSPCLGPLNGTPGLIEFTDYLCAPCRGSTGPIAHALEAHPERQVIILFVPISGALSEFAAGFAAASYFINPVIFARLHHDLMQGGMPDQTRIERLAVARGYAIDAVVREMATPRVRRYLATARALAEELGLNGVPAYLNPAGQLRLGGITKAQAVQMIAPAP